MDAVRIIPVPESSFNKNRPISDLLEGQLQHFRHLEQKLNLGLDPALARGARTEDGCARYIAAMTQALRGKAAPAKGISLVPTTSVAADGAVPGVIPAVAAAGKPDTLPASKAKRRRRTKP